MGLENQQEKNKGSVNVYLVSFEGCFKHWNLDEEYPQEIIINGK